MDIGENSGLKIVFVQYLETDIFWFEITQILGLRDNFNVQCTDII